MGRAMSFLMVASIRLSPISNVVSGALIKSGLGHGVRGCNDGPTYHSRWLPTGNSRDEGGVMAVPKGEARVQPTSMSVPVGRSAP